MEMQKKGEARRDGPWQVNEDTEEGWRKERERDKTRER